MISVCIPTYNGERFITAQLSSILSQLDITDEIIISDDKSTDDTLKIIRKFNDVRIKIYINEKKKSKHKFAFMYTTDNLENALKHATGDFIYLADQDDVWREDKISKTQILFKDYDLILSDCILIDENSNKIYDSYFEINKSKKGLFKNIVSNSYLGCCMAFKRDALFQILPFPKFSVPHDIWIGLLGEIYSKVYFESEKLVKYRRHGENLSPSGGISPNTLIYKLSYRFRLIIAIILRMLSVHLKEKKNIT